MVCLQRYVLLCFLAEYCRIDGGGVFGSFTHHMYLPVFFFVLECTALAGSSSGLASSNIGCGTLVSSSLTIICDMYGQTAATYPSNCCGGRGSGLPLPCNSNGPSWPYVSCEYRTVSVGLLCAPADPTYSWPTKGIICSSCIFLIAFSLLRCLRHTIQKIKAQKAPITTMMPTVIMIVSSNVVTSPLPLKSPMLCSTTRLRPDVVMLTKANVHGHRKGGAWELAAFQLVVRLHGFETRDSHNTGQVQPSAA